MQGAIEGRNRETVLPRKKDDGDSLVKEKGLQTPVEPERRTDQNGLGSRGRPKGQLDWNWGRWHAPIRQRNNSVSEDDSECPMEPKGSRKKLNPFKLPGKAQVSPPERCDGEVATGKGGRRKTGELVLKGQKSEEKWRPFDGARKVADLTQGARRTGWKEKRISSKN